MEAGKISRKLGTHLGKQGTVRDTMGLLHGGRDGEDAAKVSWGQVL